MFAETVAVVTTGKLAKLDMWQENAYIYGYDLDTQSKFEISVTSEYLYGLDIYENIVVWADNCQERMSFHHKVLKWYWWKV